LKHVGTVTDRNWVEAGQTNYKGNFDTDCFDMALGIYNNRKRRIYPDEVPMADLYTLDTPFGKLYNKLYILPVDIIPTTI